MSTYSQVRQLEDPVDDESEPCVGVRKLGDCLIQFADNNPDKVKESQFLEKIEEKARTMWIQDESK